MSHSHIKSLQLNWKRINDHTGDTCPRKSKRWQPTVGCQPCDNTPRPIPHDSGFLRLLFYRSTVLHKDMVYPNSASRPRLFPAFSAASTNHQQLCRALSLGPCQPRLLPHQASPKQMLDTLSSSDDTLYLEITQSNSCSDIPPGLERCLRD